METEVAEAGWTAVLCRYWDLILEESLLTFVFLAIGACLIFLIYFEGVRSEPRLCLQRERWASPPESDVGRTGQGKQSLQSQGAQWQISILLATRVWNNWAGPPLSGSDWLVRSQHHLWLGVHLFWITAPPLDLQLAVEGQLSKSDTEFEDTSWKNTLLMQLRFPWVTDKCNRMGMIDQVFFPLASDWSSRIC